MDHNTVDITKTLSSLILDVKDNDQMDISISSKDRKRSLCVLTKEKGGFKEEIYVIDKDGILYKCPLKNKKYIMEEKAYKVGFRKGKIGYGCKKFDSNFYNETLSSKILRELDVDG
jgi:transposase-like protein